jgi:polysaccharide export outer membrane protein
MMKIKKQLVCLAFCLTAGIFSSAHAQDAFLSRYGTNVISGELRALEESKLGPSDVISIQVFEEPTLTFLEGLRIEPDGKIGYPLLGDLHLAGMTPSEAGKKIKDLLAKDYIREPHVIVQVLQYNNRSVSVYGAVNQPSLLELPPGRILTIMEAIAQARGFNDVANKNRIKLIRPGKQEREFTEDELNKMEFENDPSKMIYLQPGDRIEVGERRF